MIVHPTKIWQNSEPPAFFKDLVKDHALSDFGGALLLEVIGA